MLQWSRCTPYLCLDYIGLRDQELVYIIYVYAICLVTDRIRCTHVLYYTTIKEKWSRVVSCRYIGC